MTKEKIIVGWTQSICGTCWWERFPSRPPVRVNDVEREQCCDCGMPTTSGIYWREDPMLVRYPRPKDGLIPIHPAIAAEDL
jgi:hypothetical protein